VKQISNAISQSSSLRGAALWLRSDDAVHDESYTAQQVADVPAESRLRGCGSLRYAMAAGMGAQLAGDAQKYEMVCLAPCITPELIESRDPTPAARPARTHIPVIVLIACSQPLIRRCWLIMGLEQFLRQLPRTNNLMHAPLVGFSPCRRWIG
jgi:hypothetical protein